MKTLIILILLPIGLMGQNDRIVSSQITATSTFNEIWHGEDVAVIKDLMVIHQQRSDTLFIDIEQVFPSKPIFRWVFTIEDGKIVYLGTQEPELIEVKKEVTKYELKYRDIGK